MMECKICSEKLKTKLVDLGSQPLSNDYLYSADLKKEQAKYPLVVWICENCWLVQAEEHQTKENIFKHDYSYFSSTSTSWLEHNKRFSNKIIKNLNLNEDSYVLEIASNDGYLLQFFLENNIKCLGIEPATEVAEVAKNKGIPTKTEFFDTELASKLVKEEGKPDLIICNNVLAHVPNLNDFVRGLQLSLSQEGTISIEVPSVANLILGKQFDTIYHEHFSYFSLISLTNLFKKNGLKIYDLETLTTHGGSYRILVSHVKSKHRVRKSVQNNYELEVELGLNSISFYTQFQEQAEAIRDEFKNFLIAAKTSNQTVIAYGAAAKGNTLLNFAHIGPELLSVVCDAALSKQGKFLPGSKIPIVSPSYLTEKKLDYVVVLPWNLASEIKSQLFELTARGTKLVTFVPTFKIL